MNVKQLLLGSRLGEIAMFTREKVKLLRLALFHSEEVGTLANDQAAGLLVASICEEGKAFLDVGAHIGSVISAVRRHDSTVKIIAIEAIPEKAERLRRKFPFAVVHGCAVGEENGFSAFFIDTRLTGYSSLISPERSAAKVREIQVEIRRLDELIASDCEIDVIKLDIEGAELGALRGAVDLLTRHSPVVMFESAPEQNESPYSKIELFHFFQRLDYLIVIPNRLAHKDDGLTVDGFLESHLYPRRTTNYFAVHRTRRTEIRDRARKILSIRGD